MCHAAAVPITVAQIGRNRFHRPHHRPWNTNIRHGHRSEPRHRPCGTSRQDWYTPWVEMYCKTGIKDAARKPSLPTPLPSWYYVAQILHASPLPPCRPWSSRGLASEKRFWIKEQTACCSISATFGCCAGGLKAGGRTTGVWSTVGLIFVPDANDQAMVSVGRWPD